ncbi:unnamed protein product, partial [Urochloa humidicola]
RGGQQQSAGRPAGLGVLALLCASLLLNALLLAHHFLSPSELLDGDDGGSSSCGLSWSLPAAREAEAVAATDCSGHGRVFLDGVAGEDGRPTCECNACFGGPDCSLRTPNCTADADRWALIRDDAVAARVQEYVSNSIMGASRDTQLRMLGIVKAMLANLHGEDDIFAFGHDVMRTRWRRLNAVVSRSRRISLQRMAPEFCTYFNRIREPSPAYAWVKCEREEDEDCYEALLKAKIITRSGVKNEAGKQYTRISLLKSDDDFDVLMERVMDLVNAENYDEDAPRSSSM